VTTLPVTLAVLLCSITGSISGHAQIDKQPAAAPPAKSELADKKSPTFLPAGEDPENRLVTPLMKHLAHDQKQFWAEGFHWRWPEVKGVAPFAAFTAGLVASDAALSRRVPASAAQIDRSQRISDYATYSLLGTAGAAYFWGHIIHDDHLRETGFLAGEAAVNSTAVAYLLKIVTGRPRPLDGDRNGMGRFFREPFSNGGASFPSEHSALAWSVASVVAHEYPGTLTKIAAYGLASTVTVTRVTGKQHFPSDVVVGSALGWYFARQVYRAHHDPELGGTSWGDLQEDDVAGTDVNPGANPSMNPSPNARLDKEEKIHNPAHMASPYVPLDSWVYPALDRLAGFGYVKTAFAGLKPWTRLGCASLVEEAGERLQAAEGFADFTELESRLREEFADEFRLLDGGRNLHASLESVYARGISIAGPALSDSYHFGQTVAYDSGRPFERGTNGQAGGAVRAAAGPFALYLRAEYQHAPAAPAPSAAVRDWIALKDDTPRAPDARIPGINRLRLLDTYLVMNLSPLQLGGWQVSLGRESHSWGPGPGGSFLLSDNAEPVDMIEVENPEPIRLPLFSRFLGPARFDQFLGRLAGRSDHPKPWVYGQKISFRPWSGLEIGYGRITTIGGRGGDPFTLNNFALSFLGQVSHKLGSVPGDNDNEMDWTFYVPQVRNYIVLYGEVYAEDDFVAWVRPSAYPYRPGIYLTRIPGIPKLDLHIEAANTETPGWHGVNGGNQGRFVYFDTGYHQADTNHGFLMGNTVGRMGQTMQGWLTYWASSTNRFQFIYKNSSVDRAFIPGGGAWQDYAGRHEIHMRSGLYLKSQVQYEHISRYPLLFSGPQHNLTMNVELGFLPHQTR
jgi:membrane-associated phospholipid phosphatase